MLQNLAQVKKYIRKMVVKIFIHIGLSVSKKMEIIYENKNIKEEI